MSFFEAIMLFCFGAAWPVSIYKSYRSRSNAGKSVGFLVIILVGYVAGICHKLLYHLDPVVWLYVLNAMMVAADIALYARNRMPVERAAG
jgi:lipopolysaccharide export LptBFGC system permease protein LptF